MKIIKLLSLSLLLVGSSFPPLCAESFRTDINPALLYYRAFLAAPEPGLSDADRTYLESKKGLEQKLPDRFGKIVASYDNQIQLVRQAANSRVPCDWGMDLSAGPNTLLPHVGRARAAVRPSQFRARWALEHGRQEDARDELLAAFVLARNVGSDRLLINALVQNAMEGMVYGTVAFHFGEFSPGTLQQLAAGFDVAPPRCTV